MKRNEPVMKVATADVKSAHVGQPLSAVAEMIHENGFRHVPVVDGRTPVGMISATDIFKLVYDHDSTDTRMAAAILDHEHNVADTMSTELKTLDTSATVFDAATALSTGEFSSLVVVDGDGELAGLVTTVDLIQYLLEQY